MGKRMTNLAYTAVAVRVQWDLNSRPLDCKVNALHMASPPL